jgi:DNA-binding response OmpR family regulator
MRILVVDDDDQLREMLRKMLEKAGYEVVEASDGRDALNLQEKSPADLIITDIIMPEKEGIDTIMDFRMHYPQVRIIAMSGGGRIGPTEYLDLAEKLGADKTFAKPFSSKALLATIHELLHQNNP